MWPSIYAYIKESYAPTDVNIDGYVEQFKDNHVQHVINSLTSDWKKCKQQETGIKEEKSFGKYKEQMGNACKRMGDVRILSVVSKLKKNIIDIQGLA